MYEHTEETRSGRSPRYRRHAALVLVGLLSIGFSTDGRTAEDAPGMWAILTATDVLPGTGDGNRWYYWVDAQARYSDIGSGGNQYLIRPAIGYRPGSNVSYWLGYARFRTRSANGNVVDENRYWQQASWTVARWDRGVLSMRARLEQRDVESGDDTGLALRYLIRYTQPIGDTGTKRLILGVEPFYNLRDTDWGGKAGMAQNRIYAGVGWRASDRVTVDTGYMNQYVWRRNAEDSSNHLLVVNFRTKF